MVERITLLALIVLLHSSSEGAAFPGSGTHQQPPGPSDAPISPSDAPDKPKIHRVEPGLAWQLVAQDAKPGDQILLEKGIHINGRIEGLHGTRERPIVIRGAELDVPTAIACEATGIELVRCSWVRIENFFFINPLDAAIVIDGTPLGAGGERTSDCSIAIAACRILTSKEIPGLDCIRIINARMVGIADCRFESWSDAAVELRGAATVIITRCIFSPTAESKHAFGVRVLDDSDMVVVVQNTFERGIGTGVQVGNCGAGHEREGADATSVSRGVQITRCVFVDVDCPVEVGGASTTTMSECTIADPLTPYRIDATCGAPTLSISRSLFRWIPGRLLSLAERRGDTTPAMVTLGENLWWSEELPTMLDVLGHHYGTMNSKQVIDIDPKLSEAGYEPLEERAKRFGWLAPVPVALIPVAAPTESGTSPSGSGSATKPE